MAAQTTQLLLHHDLQDVGKTRDLTTSDREALRAVSEWIDDFVARPHKDLGRGGAICPVVPGSLERRTLWLAAEHVGDLGTAEVVELMDDYKRLFLQIAPADSDDAIYKTIIVVFPDLPAERAGALFTDVLDQLAEPAYEEDGILFGPFYRIVCRTVCQPRQFRPRVLAHCHTKFGVEFGHGQELQVRVRIAVTTASRPSSAQDGVAARPTVLHREREDRVQERHDVAHRFGREPTLQHRAC